MEKSLEVHKQNAGFSLFFQYFQRILNPYDSLVLHFIMKVHTAESKGFCIKHARHARGREFRGLGYTRHIRTNVRILGNSGEFPTIYSEETHDTPLPVVCMLDSGLRKRA